MATKKVLLFYKPSDPHIPKVEKWLPFYGGQLCILSVQNNHKQLIRLVDGKDLTVEFHQDKTVTNPDKDQYFTYFDPTYMMDSAIYGANGLQTFHYVGSFNRQADNPHYEYEANIKPTPEPSSLQIGYSAEVNQFIVLLDEYISLNIAIRGEGPVFKRYFEVRMNKEYRRGLYKMFSNDPKTTHTFDEFENTIYDFAVYLYRSYITRFVKRENIRLKSNEYIFLDACHKEYKLKRDAGEREKITVDKVIDKLNNLAPDNLYYLVNDFHTRGGTAASSDTNHSHSHSHSHTHAHQHAAPKNSNPKTKRLIQQSQASKKKDHVPA